jgi:hypothetical protein
MSEPNDTNANGHEADSEVELSAAQLRALSVTSTSKEPQPQPESVTRRAELLVNLPDSPSQSASLSEAHGSQSYDHRSASVRVGRSLAIVVAVMVTGGVLHHYLTNGDSDHSASRTLTRSAPQPEWAIPEPSGDPVRFANPFDASETFEFPAGTTETEAREAVADFLLERAMNRQARLDLKPSRMR